MELRQLKYFVTTAETLSFSDAARKLFISQSTLSQQIRQLESELGTELFKRDSHNVALTEAGDRLLPLARTAIYDADICKTQMLDLQEEVSGTLNVGLIYSFSHFFVEPMRRFLLQYRNVKLNIYYTNSRKLLDLLRRRKIDFALAFRTGNGFDDVESQVLFKDTLCAVVRKDHILADKKKITLEELQGYGIVMPACGMQSRLMLDEYLSLSNANLKVRIELNDANLMVNLISNSALLVGLLTADTVSHHPDLRAIPLDVPDNAIYGCLHVLNDAYVKRSARILMDMIEEKLAKTE